MGRRKGRQPASLGSGTSEPAAGPPSDTVGSPCPSDNTPVPVRRRGGRSRSRSPESRPAGPSTAQLALLPDPAASEGSSVAVSGPGANDTQAAAHAMAMPPSSVDNTMPLARLHALERECLSLREQLLATQQQLRQLPDQFRSMLDTAKTDFYHNCPYVWDTLHLARNDLFDLVGRLEQRLTALAGRVDALPPPVPPASRLQPGPGPGLLADITARVDAQLQQHGASLLAELQARHAAHEQQLQRVAESHAQLNTSLAAVQQELRSQACPAPPPLPAPPVAAAAPPSGPAVRPEPADSPMAEATAPPPEAAAAAAALRPAPGRRRGGSGRGPQPRSPPAGVLHAGVDAGKVLLRGVPASLLVALQSGACGALPGLPGPAGAVQHFWRAGDSAPTSPTPSYSVVLSVTAAQGAALRLAAASLRRDLALVVAPYLTAAGLALRRERAALFEVLRASGRAPRWRGAADIACAR